jgi:hypothetical protein
MYTLQLHGFLNVEWGSEEEGQEWGWGRGWWHFDLVITFQLKKRFQFLYDFGWPG